MRRWLCRVGFHTRLVTGWGRSPAKSFRRCMECGAVWQGTYDGIEAGWRRMPEGWSP